MHNFRKNMKEAELIKETKYEMNKKGVRRLRKKLLLSELPSLEQYCFLKKADY